MTVLGKKRRLRGRKSEEGFQAINITPFTDVLLVLLIIFLIAGSSLTPSGVDVDKLVRTASSTSDPSGKTSEFTLFVTTEGALRARVDGRWSEQMDLDSLPRDKAINFTAAATTKVNLIVERYDFLLKSGFTNVRLAPPEDVLEMEFE